MPGNNTRMLDCALDALSRGFSVFPCGVRSKIPAFELTEHGCKDATTDEARVREWWARGAKWNIAVLNGTVVDCDTGIDDLRGARNFAMLSDLPPTLAIRTGRRSSYGVQFHFSGQSVSGNYLANGVSGEVRSGNLNGLFAGSVHPETGAEYAIAIDLPRAAVPDNILRDFRTDGTGLRTGTGRISGQEYTPIDIETARERYHSVLFRAATAPKGTRHHAANNVAYFAARGLLAGIFAEQTFQGVLLSPGFSEIEIKLQIYSAVKTRYARGERNIRKMLSDSWESGIQAGRLSLDLYAEDFADLQSLSDDERFQHGWDGICSDFSCAVECRDYMAQVLKAAGCADVSRILKASKIDEMVAFQHAFERTLK
jgi:bifunctional DNA primase/polymerase-like protein